MKHQSHELELFNTEEPLAILTATLCESENS